MWFNKIIAWLLRSPLHGALSRNLVLVTVTGRKSGRSFSAPVNYLRQGNTLWIISWRERTWWRNLRRTAAVKVLLAGKSLSGSGQVIEEEQAVARSLVDYYRLAPGSAKFAHIRLDSDGQPVVSDCELAAHKLVVVRIDLD